MNNSNSSDEQIASAVQRGEVGLFGELVGRYEAKMKRYSRKFLFGYHESEDLAQEVFLKAYSNIQSFDSSRSFSSWLYRIAHNEFINAIKKKGREPVPFFDPDTVFPHPIAKDSADSNVHAQETRAMLDRCLYKLDPKYREPLVLFYFEDLSYQAISEIMHVPISTVGVRITRGKSILRVIYKQLFPAE